MTGNKFVNLTFSLGFHAFMNAGLLFIYLVGIVPLSRHV